MTKCLVRPATFEDSAGAVALLRESIIELCVDDHRNDPQTLERSLANKTTDQFRRWLAASDSLVVVAFVESTLSGVGSVKRSGEIGLCYVQPTRQRAGVGRALLQALEAQAMSWGLGEVRLRSSANARSFYERHGYISAGESTHAFGVLWDYPYRKIL